MGSEGNGPSSPRLPLLFCREGWIRDRPGVAGLYEPDAHARLADLAEYDAEGLSVYQVFRPALVDEALRRDTFGPGNIVPPDHGVLAVFARGLLPGLVHSSCPQ